mmetsp:Transcript_12382/g.14216  ORF Transcript_12382/g.14216 Transcript_12382/m.14216 type:complete len:85 (-) Transcript_12382:3920-4174(-)
MGKLSEMISSFKRTSLVISIPAERLAKKRNRRIKYKSKQKSMQYVMEDVSPCDAVMAFDDEDYCTCHISLKYGACKHDFPGIVF